VIESSFEDRSSVVVVWVVVVVLRVVAVSSEPLNVCAIATVANTAAATSDAASTGQFLRIRWSLFMSL
jgi:hypothetical protein